MHTTCRSHACHMATTCPSHAGHMPNMQVTCISHAHLLDVFLQGPDSTFSAVPFDQCFYGLFTKLQLYLPLPLLSLGCQPRPFSCLGHQVLVSDGQLLLSHIASYRYDLHPVPQSSWDSVRDVGCADEQHLGDQGVWLAVRGVAGRGCGWRVTLERSTGTSM